MGTEPLQIPGFKIRRLLGAGGMAKVYLADQESLDREVALKVMATELVAGDESFCQRFLKEGQIIAKLHHKNIITIHDIGCTVDKIYYMAMEYCPGGTLKERIKQGISVHEAIRVVRQVAAALGYAHEKGFVHRDIKPANVLFGDDMEAVLSDFGIAKTMDARTQLTQSGLAIGTPEYMSPEQATGRKLGGGSDLYSLGVVLYEMLLGVKPFISTDAVSAAVMHVQKPIPLLPSEFAGLQHIIDGLMAKQVDERIPSAANLIEELNMLEIARPVVQPNDVTQVISPSTREAITLHRTKRGAGKRTGRTTKLLFAAAGSILTIGAAILAYKAVTESQTIVALESEPTSDAQKSGLVGTSPPGVAIEDSKENQKRIGFLLDVARAHVAIGRIHEPRGSNAIEAYKMVLQVDPRNREAIEALEQLETFTEKEE